VSVCVVQDILRPRETIIRYQRKQIIEKGRVLPQPPYEYPPLSSDSSDVSDLSYDSDSN